MSASINSSGYWWTFKGFGSLSSFFDFIVRLVSSLWPDARLELVIWSSIVSHLVLKGLIESSSCAAISNMYMHVQKLGHWQYVVQSRLRRLYNTTNQLCSKQILEGKQTTNLQLTSHKISVVNSDWPRGRAKLSNTCNEFEFGQCTRWRWDR